MTTGTVLFEKNADQRMPTSSMSKIMTAYMLFEAIEQGRVSLDDTFTVSEKADRKSGVSGKIGGVRVDILCLRILKKYTHTTLPPPSYSIISCVDVTYTTNILKFKKTQ